MINFTFKEENKQAKPDRKLKTERKFSDRATNTAVAAADHNLPAKINESEDENMSDDSNISEKNIITEIYKSTFEQQQQQILLNSQLSNGIDQYTLHSFSYLHPVAKPPLAEYTSITDCIDTSTLDRPPSPPILSFNNKFSATNLDSNPSNPSTGQLVNATKTYCSSESARSAVARQESEILRLAEESQHVIISQMLNKLVKKTDFNSSDTNHSQENAEKPASINSSEIISVEEAAEAEEKQQKTGSGIANNL